MLSEISLNRRLALEVFLARITVAQVRQKKQGSNKDEPGVKPLSKEVTDG